MAKEVLDTILSIQPKDSSGVVGETRESIVYRIADDMLNKLPSDYIPHEVCTIFFVTRLIFHEFFVGQITATENGCTLIYEHLPPTRDRLHAEGDNTGS